MQGVVERTQIGIDLRHHVARQEAQALACLDRRAGEDDALDLAGLQSPNRHRNGEPRLAGTRRTDAEGDHVVRDRLDVRLLTRRLRPDHPSLVGAKDVVGEDRRGFLVSTNHVDRAVERALIDALTTLGEHHELLE